MSIALSAFANQWFVVKLGGELVAPNKLNHIATALKAFTTAGIKVCVIHGGGPQATALTKRLGLTPQQIAGRRVTDAEVLQVMKQTLGGEVSVDVASLMNSLGVKALALHGVSGALIQATKRPPKVITGGPAEPVDLGFVGDVTKINTDLLEKIVSIGYTPMLASIGGDLEGNVFNINADTVAQQVAKALDATKLFLVSGVPGVLRDFKDHSTRIPSLTAQEAKEAITSGVIAGGMIAKVEEGLAALSSGAAVHICGSSEGDLLEEATQPGSRGTVFQTSVSQ
jgi:acetylglutamate kinase